MNMNDTRTVITSYRRGREIDASVTESPLWYREIVDIMRYEKAGNWRVVSDAPGRVMMRKGDSDLLMVITRVAA